jgi:16S rRNA (cytidine1402-2'-O)-methyltransferase
MPLKLNKNEQFCNMPNGTLFLIPVPLADEAAAKTFTPYLVDTINNIKEYILKEAGLKTPQSQLVMHDYGKHKRGSSLGIFFVGLQSGKDTGLMSEAGCPGVADPGAEIVAEAHRRGIKVVPLVGPSSILLALMASGFNGQSFAFQGYLPIDKAERSKRIRELEGLSDRLNQTQIFIETPFRNNPMLEEILKTGHPKTKLCIASNLTAADEFVQTKTIAEWQTQIPDLHKKPTIFIISRSI